MDARSLVLTWGEEPHRIVSWQRAACMVIKGKVDVLRTTIVPSGRMTIELPAVVKLRREVPFVRRSTRFGRLSVYLRDGFRCCYCNAMHEPEDLTYDHVIPRIQWDGDPRKLTDWENIVTACWDCNQRKGSRTPKLAGMKLLRKPYRPTQLPPLPFFWPKEPPEAWRKWQPAASRIANDVAAA